MTHAEWCAQLLARRTLATKHRVCLGSPTCKVQQVHIVRCPVCGLRSELGSGDRHVCPRQAAHE
jgi:hypothetical protein